MTGTKEQPITLRSAPGEAVLVTGADRVRNWQPESGPATNRGPAWIRDNWTHRNLAVIPSRPGDEERARWDPTQVFVDGVYCEQVMHRTDMEPGTFYLAESNGSTKGAAYPLPCATGPFVHNANYSQIAVADASGICSTLLFKNDREE